MSNSKAKLNAGGGKRNLLLTALIAVILSFSLASLVMWATGINPANFFKALLQTMTGMNLDKVGEKNFFRPRYIGEFLQTSMPLILAALGVGFANRSGLFNIGAEGQLIAGIVGADLVALLLPVEGPLLAVCAVLGAALAGSLWAFIPGFLKAFFGVHEVVSTIMFNYMAMHLNNWILTSLPGSSAQRTADLPKDALLGTDALREFTGKSRFHWGFIVVIICLILYQIILQNSRFGYELRAVGFNKHASEYAGINSKRRTIESMLIAGAFCGLGGAMIALGTFNYGRVLTGFENYGFDGLAVSLLGGNTAIGILLGGLLLGGLKSGQALMQAMRVPLEIAQIVSALLILFVAMQHGIERLIARFKGGQVKVATVEESPTITETTLPVTEEIKEAVTATDEKEDEDGTH